MPPGDTIYYVDPETAEPLGSKTTIVVHEPRVRDGKVVAGEPQDPITVTTTVDRYEHLEPTPENLKLLDAPNIDAAQEGLDGEGAGATPASPPSIASGATSSHPPSSREA